MEKLTTSILAIFSTGKAFSFCDIADALPFYMRKDVICVCKDLLNAHFIICSDVEFDIKIQNTVPVYIAENRAYDAFKHLKGSLKVCSPDLNYPQRMEFIDNLLAS